MGFLDIENVEETNEVTTSFSIKNININNIDNDVKPGINVEMELNLTGDAYQAKEVNILTDLLLLFALEYYCFFQSAIFSL